MVKSCNIKDAIHFIYKQTCYDKLQSSRELFCSGCPKKTRLNSNLVPRVLSFVSGKECFDLYGATDRKPITMCVKPDQLAYRAECDNTWLLKWALTVKRKHLKKVVLGFPLTRMIRFRQEMLWALLCLLEVLYPNERSVEISEVWRKTLILKQQCFVLSCSCFEGWNRNKHNVDKAFFGMFIALQESNVTHLRKQETVKMTTLTCGSCNAMAT